MIRLEQPATSDWDFPRTVAGLTVLVEAGRDAGAPPAELLSGSGISEADLEDPQGEVTAEQELRVVRNLRRMAPGVTGGDVGRRYHVSTFGFLGFALLSSRTLLDAMNLALRFIDLSFTFGMPSATVENTDVVIRVDGSSVPADVEEFLVDRDLSAIGAIIGELVPTGVGLRRSGATMRFDARHLDTPLPQSHPQTLAVCERLCLETATDRRRRTGLVQDVRVLVAQTVGRGAPMTEVAARLGLSTRTLRRRLAAEGVTYKTLVDEVRASLAVELLSSAGLSVEDTAIRLGYAESASFIHAYRRWNGVTPSAHRQQLIAQRPRR